MSRDVSESSMQNIPDCNKQSDAKSIGIMSLPSLPEIVSNSNQVSSIGDLAVAEINLHSKTTNLMAQTATVHFGERDLKIAPPHLLAIPILQDGKKSKASKVKSNHFMSESANKRLESPHVMNDSNIISSKKMLANVASGTLTQNTTSKARKRLNKLAQSTLGGNQDVYAHIASPKTTSTQGMMKTLNIYQSSTVPTKYNVPNTYGGQVPNVAFQNNLLSQQKASKKRVKRRTTSNM